MRENPLLYLVACVDTQEDGTVCKLGFLGESHHMIPCTGFLEGLVAFLLGVVLTSVSSVFYLASKKT